MWPHPEDKGGKVQAQAPRGLQAISWVLLALSLTYFTWRGVWRGLGGSPDLTVGYSAARALWHGVDPYLPQVLARELAAGGGADLAATGLMDFMRNIYVPTTLPAFLPLAVFPWPVAKVLWVVCNAGGMLFIALGLARLLGWRATAPKSLVMTAFLLALMPAYETTKLGQTPIACTAALVAAMLLERRGLSRRAGLLYGLCAAIKVQIGLPFLAYVLWRRRWGAAAVAGALLMVSTGAAVLRMETAAPSWAGSWSANLAQTATGGGANDPSPLNPMRSGMINLQYPLHVVIQSPVMVNGLTLVLVGVGALATVRLIRGGDSARELLALSLVAVLTLLVVYHRNYDAVLLAIPIAWACGVLHTEARWQGVVLLVLAANYLAPTPMALEWLERQALLPGWLTKGWLWELVLLPQQVWVLVLMTLVLLATAWKGSGWPLRPNPTLAKA